MAKKSINWKTKGMNRDTSVSAFSPEFAFENINLRLSTNESNTMLSWVNEKGTEELELLINTTPLEADSEYSESSITGVVIGTAIINHYLILFTHNATDSIDKIYKFWYTSGNKESMYGIVLYSGNLGFSTDYPIETIVDYETDSIQKVYWTDGKNQPRLINIAADNTTISRWNSSLTPFDFVPSFNASSLSVSITNTQASSGTFAPGVIQYCFTYINKYGQQSNIVYCSTLYYLSNANRGASPEERVSSIFNISISGLDSNFDYVRLYSIQRTSVNDTPYVKLLDDLPIESNSVSYVDNGTTGSTMDPTELLYVGGIEISALTMESKDGTLFMGNLEQKNANIDSIQEYFKTNTPTINFNQNKSYSLGTSNGYYSYKYNLGSSQKDITTFKGGEYYRFGFQLQKATGEWSDPIFIGDKQNEYYPTSSNLITASATISIGTIASKYGSDFYKVFKRIRPLIVYPNVNDRSVLCQGVLNPTVFNVEDRATHSPDAQPSWFFRPYHSEGLSSGSGSSTYTTTLGVETTSSSQTISGIKKSEIAPNEVNESSAFNSSRQYFVIVGNITSSRATSILNSGELRYRESPDSAISIINFVGVIRIGTEDSSDKYAFFGNTAFPNNKRSGKESLYYLDITSVEYSSANFSLYSMLQTNSSKYFYYYSSDSDAPPQYKLKFFTDNKDWYTKQQESSTGEVTYGPPVTLYEVTFTKVTSTSTTVDAVNQGGSALRFLHYQSLFSDAEAGNSLNNIKQVEIQGSVNKYSSFSGGTTSVNSNTQFFIDQSIVTLNSPDLEFDTNVQNANTDSLKLRIIGAIPISATASSHTIKTSSAMLETNYNSKEDNNTSSRKFGTGEKDINVVSRTSAFKRLVADKLWNDAKISVTIEDENKIVTTDERTVDYTIYPWHRTGPLNNDPRGKAEASSFLQYKRLANLMFSDNSTYLSSSKAVSIDTTGVQIPLTENAEVMNYRLGSNLNYYANIDKVLVNGDGYYIKTGASNVGTTKTTDAISMKYKSTTHAAISLDGKILPKANNNIGAASNLSGSTFWGGSVNFSQSSINYSNSNGFLWLGELYRTNNTNRFGGSNPTKSMLLNNKWVPAGETQTINGNSDITLQWTDGDTYYQRYDCLKTYPFTEDDPNQIIEILSFMCETHINIDGRYDRNRGMMNNVNIRPTNFNLLNHAYSQRNNFFTYRKIDTENNESLKYPNQIYYSKTKTSGADVDMWTNVTLASTLEMDGNKGSINSIQRFNDQLVAFQDSGIAQILYNENVQIATTQGVPIEIANSGKVQGKRYISNTVGCSNKWAITQSPSGIYFIDSNDKGIYLFNGQLNNLSAAKGFNTWCKKNIPSSDINWDPVNYNNFRAYYDKINQDVLFINKDTALAYSEKLGNFTSFYDYGNAPFFENLDDTGIWIKDNKLWKHQAGEYCKFFGVNKPYSMTLIANQEPLLDKIFTNIEFRSNVDGEGDYTAPIEAAEGVEAVKENYVPYTPFDSLEAWNEYQHGISDLNLRAAGSSRLKSSLERKFRIWRCDIPRDNAPLEGTTDDETTSILEDELAKGIKRFKVRPLDRMRNPWVYLKLEKKAARNELLEDEEEGTSLPSLAKAEIHDLVATYYS